MVNVVEIEAAKFLAALAAELKKMPEFEMPTWAAFVKTGINKKRPPIGEWWYIRAASILRQLYIHPVVGVGRLRTKYGGRQDRGMKPARFKKAAGKNIRVILQQAEKAGLVEKVKGKKAGRQLTRKGREFLEKIASQIKE